MYKTLKGMPSLDPEERMFIENLVKDFDEKQLDLFEISYLSKRKDSTLILILAILGIFISIHGIHRFLCGNIGMGILYLFTGGLCWVGTIVDIINYKKLTFDKNREIAQEIFLMIKY